MQKAEVELCVGTCVSLEGFRKGGKLVLGGLVVL